MTNTKQAVEMPKEIIVQSDGIYMYPTLQNGQHVGTKYIRADLAETVPTVVAELDDDWYAEIQDLYGMTGINAVNRFLKGHTVIVKRRVP